MAGKATVEVRPTIDSIRNKKDREKLKDLLETRNQLAQEEKSAKEAKDALVPEIVQLMNKYGLKSLDMGEFTATVVEGCSAQVNKKALLEHGIDPELIEDCMSRTAYTTIQTKVKKAQEE